MDRMTDQPDLNTGKEWSKNDLFSLRNRIEHGRTVGHVATFLRRTEAEVREKAAKLGPPRASAGSDRRIAAIFESYVRFGVISGH